MEEDSLEQAEQALDQLAALVGGEVKEYELPSIFHIFKEGMRVKVQTLKEKTIKSAEVKNVVFQSKALILKMGGKTKLMKTHTPVLIDGGVYTCFARDEKRKLVMFTYVAKLADLKKFQKA